MEKRKGEAGSGHDFFKGTSWVDGDMDLGSKVKSKEYFFGRMVWWIHGWSDGRMRTGKLIKEYQSRIFVHPPTAINSGCAGRVWAKLSQIKRGVEGTRIGLVYAGSAAGRKERNKKRERNRPTY